MNNKTSRLNTQPGGFFGHWNWDLLDCFDFHCRGGHWVPGVELGVAIGHKKVYNEETTKNLAKVDDSWIQMN